MVWARWGINIRRVCTTTDSEKKNKLLPLAACFTPIWKPPPRPRINIIFVLEKVSNSNKTIVNLQMPTARILILPHVEVQSIELRHPHLRSVINSPCRQSCLRHVESLLWLWPVRRWPSSRRRFQEAVASPGRHNDVIYKPAGLYVTIWPINRVVCVWGGWACGDHASSRQETPAARGHSLIDDGVPLKI